MRKRIQRLAKGKFDYVQPVLSLSTDKLEIDVLEGQTYTGEFTITVTNHIKVKGIVYTSNPYMECLTPEFEGEEIRIRFQFHSESFMEGDISKGEFYITCNQVEYNLSFVVSVHKLYMESSIGKVRTLRDFTKLAQLDYYEAYRIFASSGFKNILKDDDVNAGLLYEGLGRMGTSMQNMEEFLVSVKAKKEVRFRLQEVRAELVDMEETQKEVFNIQKDGWGYLAFDVSTDADFLTVDKSRITMEDFVGSICEFYYYIDESKLHAGKNFGHIVFENMYQKECCQVTVIKKQESEESERRALLEEQHALAELTTVYLDYRMKKIGAGLWASKSIEVLNHLIAMNQLSDWYPLMKAQALIVSGRKQETEWILKEFKYKMPDKTSAEYAYYLYLCTLWEREESYVNKKTKEIEELYHQSNDDRIFWMLLFLKEDYCSSDSKKIREIEHRMQDGCKSPFLYIEAYYLYWQNPYLLTRLTEFETRILYWAARKSNLTGELAMQITTLSSTKRNFDPLLYKTMCMAYERYESAEMLTAICAYLIRTQRFALQYHTWFEKGIEEDLRIAGLNEAYLMSMDLLSLKKIPKLIQMYFQYNSTIPYKQKAALLANIIAAKETEPDVYHNYRKMMEDFALRQVEEGHIDDNLAIIYSDLLDKGMIQKQMAKPMARILYTHKMNCFSEKVVFMYVLHRQLTEIQRIPIINGTAYFQLYSEDYVILFEDGEGCRYASGISYQIERLMRPGVYYKTCMSYAPCEISYLLYHFAKRDTYRTFVEEDSEYLNQLLAASELRDEYRARLYPQAVQFYAAAGDTDRVCDYLKRAELALMSRKMRTFMVEQMIENRLFDLAYQYVREYGADAVNPVLMVALCGYEIEQSEYEGDDFLVTLCEQTFLRKKYSGVMLDYLAQYYCGPTKLMAQLWTAAKQFEVDTYGLEERLLVQMLYTTEFVDRVQEIYDSYRERGAVPLLEKAYTNYFSYFYFVRQGLIPHEILETLHRMYLRKEEMSEMMRLALLYALAKGDLPLEEEKNCEILEKLLGEALSKYMYFAFYQNLPDALRYRYHLYDRQFVEYRTSPMKRVVIHYRREEGFVEEEMNEVLEGIFVKDFLLFFGNEVQYYISEEDAKDTRVTESGSLYQRDICEREEKNRYDMLNAMELQLTLENYRALEELMKRHDGLRKKNETVFRVM